MNKWNIRTIKTVKRFYDEFGHRQSICEDFLGRKITIYTSSMYGDISLEFHDRINCASLTVGHMRGVGVFTLECWKVKTGLFWKPTKKSNK